MTEDSGQPPGAGWYPDPQGGTGQRWWNGEAWTDSTQEAPATQVAPASDVATRPWWKKKRFAIPIGVLVLIVLATVVDDQGDVPELADSGVPTREPAEEAIETEPERERTQGPTESVPEVSEASEEVEVSEESDEPEEEPDQEPEPEPTFEITADDARTLIFPIVWESARGGTLQVIQDLFVIETVDLYDYDVETGTVLLAATPAFDFDSGVRDDAWEVMRIYAGGLYAPGSDDWVESGTGWSPALDVTISTARYRCEGETMQALGDARLSRPQWEEQCRIN
jgi:hypothetical protein